MKTQTHVKTLLHFYTLLCEVLSTCISFIIFYWMTECCLDMPDHTQNSSKVELTEYTLFVSSEHSVICKKHVRKQCKYHNHQYLSKWFIKLDRYWIELSEIVSEKTMHVILWVSDGIFPSSTSSLFHWSFLRNSKCDRRVWSHAMN